MIKLAQLYNFLRSTNGPIYSRYWHDIHSLTCTALAGYVSRDLTSQWYPSFLTAQVLMREGVIWFDITILSFILVRNTCTINCSWMLAQIYWHCYVSIGTKFLPMKTWWTSILFRFSNYVPLACSNELSQPIKTSFSSATCMLYKELSYSPPGGTHLNSAFIDRSWQTPFLCCHRYKVNALYIRDLQNTESTCQIMSCLFYWHTISLNAYRA